MVSILSAPNPALCFCARSGACDFAWIPLIRPNALRNNVSILYAFSALAFSSPRMNRSENEAKTIRTQEHFVARSRSSEFWKHSPAVEASSYANRLLNYCLSPSISCTVVCTGRNVSCAIWNAASTSAERSAARGWSTWDRECLNVVESLSWISLTSCTA